MQAAVALYALIIFTYYKCKLLLICLNIFYYIYNIQRVRTQVLATY